MPYPTKESLPDWVKKMPKHAQEIWRKAWNSAYAQHKNDEKAFKIAIAAVKRDYKKVGDKWVKKMDEMKYLSMAISKISKRQGIMHFETTASDDDWDSDDERLTIELFEDFIRREEEKKATLEEEYIPPYLSISHFQMPVGDVNSIWIQGNRFKTRGIFYDDKYGRALFKAILQERAGGEEVENPIRVSIGFWPHDAREEDGKIAYTQGEFDHEASTRVPVNVRATFDEVIEKSMTTKKEDAASMIGEELAIELDDDERRRREKGDLEDGMVIKSEEDSPLTLLQEEVLKSLLEEEGVDSEIIEKAVWNYAYKKALPDSAYLWVEKGEGCAKKDGKTPQKCRHLPYKDKSGKVDCGHLRAAIQAVGGARTGKPMSVPSGVLSKAKRLYASNCKKKGKGLVTVEGEPTGMEYRPYGGATSIDDAVAYMESQEAVWDIRDDLHLFSEVVENILKSPEVDDKKAAIKKAVNELDKVLGEDIMGKDKESKSSVLDLIEGIKDADATEEKGDQVVAPAPEKEGSLDALFGVLKTVVHNEDLDRAGKIASAFECLKTIGAACDTIITESTPRTEADIIAEITEAASKAAVDRIIEAIKPLAEKVTVLEATLRAPSGDPQRKGLTVIEKAQVQGDEPVKKGSLKWYSRINSGLDPETGKAIF